MSTQHSAAHVSLNWSASVVMERAVLGRPTPISAAAPDAAPDALAQLLALTLR
jgi:hypothetical protein